MERQILLLASFSREADSIFCIIKGGNLCVTGPYETCKYHP